jgi:hypothetical protein
MFIDRTVAGIGLAVLAAAFAWSPSLGSQSTTLTGTASLNGMVVMIEGGVQTPLRRARATIRAADGAVRVTDSDTDGRPAPPRRSHSRTGVNPCLDPAAQPR